MDYYLAEKGAGEEFFGVPFPTVGVRVRFDAGKLFAARERRLGHPIELVLTGDEGLVVHEDPMEVLQLPDRLWRVDDLTGEVRLAPANRWLRCQSLRVREELSAWLVMGPHGDLVAQVIDQACRLTSGQVRAIAALNPADEQRLHRAVWERWLAHGRPGSPVGCGLSALHDAVTRAARRTSPDLFGWDEQDEVEVVTDPAWLQADHAAGAAALAQGAPDLLSTEDNQRLMRRWTAVFGASGHRA
ncbi:MAG: hypothetical protein ABSF03_05090 [Streptosporangiaceae bacterium]